MDHINLNFVRPVEVMRRLGLKECTLRYLERSGKFPKRQKIGARAVGWPPEVIEAWFAEYEKHCREGGA